MNSRTVLTGNLTASTPTPEPMKTHHWSAAPARGMANTASQIYRYTVVRLRDNRERFTDRLPRVEIRKSPDFLVWNNKLNQEEKP